jgi:hypothetical protein
VIVFDTWLARSSEVKSIASTCASSAKANVSHSLLSSLSEQNMPICRNFAEVSLALHVIGDTTLVRLSSHTRHTYTRRPHAVQTKMRHRTHHRAKRPHEHLLTAALLCLAAPASAQQRRATTNACFDLKHGYSALKRMLAAPAKVNHDAAWYYQQTDGADQCQQLCALDDRCKAFVYMGDAKRDKWAHGCYGRTDAVSVMVPEPGRTSGLKVPCAGDEARDRAAAAGATSAAADATASSFDAASSAGEPSASGACKATCNVAGDGLGHTCDEYTQNTCKQLEAYGCDCRGCACKNDAGASSSASASAAASSRAKSSGANADAEDLASQLERLMGKKKPAQAASATDDQDDALERLLGRKKQPAPDATGAAGSVAAGAADSLMERLLEKRQGDAGAADAASATGTCKATCNVAGDGLGHTCDEYTQNTCKQLEAYGCDCSGCACKNDEGASTSASASAAAKASAKSNGAGADDEDLASQLERLMGKKKPAQAASATDDQDDALQRLLGREKQAAAGATGAADSAADGDDDLMERLMGRKKASAGAAKAAPTTGTCKATCNVAGDGLGHTCDEYTQNTCKQLEAYGCDCSGCACKNDEGASTSASASAAAKSSAKSNGAGADDGDLASQLERLMGKNEPAQAASATDDQDDALQRLLGREKQAAAGATGAADSAADGDDDLMERLMGRKKASAGAAKAAPTTGTCKATCNVAGDGLGHTCDEYTQNTCKQLEAYGCDCSGCACKNDEGASASASASAAAGSSAKTSGAGAEEDLAGRLERMVREKKAAQAAVSGKMGGAGAEEDLASKLERMMREKKAAQAAASESASAVDSADDLMERLLRKKKAPAGGAAAQGEAPTKSAGRAGSGGSRGVAGETVADGDLMSLLRKKETSRASVDEPESDERAGPSKVRRGREAAASASASSDASGEALGAGSSADKKPFRMASRSRVKMRQTASDGSAVPSQQQAAEQAGAAVESMGTSGRATAAGARGRTAEATSAAAQRRRIGVDASSRASEDAGAELQRLRAENARLRREQEWAAQERTMPPQSQRRPQRAEEQRAAPRESEPEKRRAVPREPEPERQLFEDAAAPSDLDMMD